MPLQKNEIFPLHTSSSRIIFLSSKRLITSSECTWMQVKYSKIRYIISSCSTMEFMILYFNSYISLYISSIFPSVSTIFFISSDYINRSGVATLVGDLVIQASWKRLMENGAIICYQHCNLCIPFLVSISLSALFT